MATSKKNFKVETQIWLNKIQKIKIKSKFRLTVIFSKFLENIIEHTVGYTLGFEKIISTQIKFLVQMYKYLNSNSDTMCKCTSSNTNSIKFYMQAMYHLQFKMSEGSNL